MAKTMKGFDDLGQIKGGKLPRGSLDEPRTIKENVAGQLVGKAAKGLGGAVIKCLTNRRCG